MLRRRRLRSWLLLTVAAFIAAEAAVASNTSWQMTAGVLRAAALVFALAGASGELQRLYRQSDLARAEADAERRAREANAHDARTSLAAIEAAAWALGSVDEPAEFHEAIQAEVSVLRRLLARPRVNGIVKRLLIADIISWPAAIARGRGTDVKVSVPRHLEAWADPDAMTCIVHNLIDNALCHAPGSSIRVTAGLAGDMIELCVADEGPGIPPHILPRIFERGISHQSDGSGIGLSIVAELVAAQQGTISAENLAYGGAAFVVRLPAHRTEAVLARAG